MSDGISGFGTTVVGSVSGAIGQLIGVSIPGMSVNDINVSTMSSANAWNEYIAGMKEAGEIGLTMLYEKANKAVLLGALGGANETWTVTFPDDSTFIVSGYIKSLGTEIPMNDKIAQSAAIKLSGEPDFNPSSGT